MVDQFNLFDAEPAPVAVRQDPCAPKVHAAKQAFVHSEIPVGIDVSPFEWWEEAQMAQYLLDKGWWVMQAPDGLWLIGRHCGDAYREETFSRARLAALAVREGYLKYRKSPEWKDWKRKFLAASDAFDEDARDRHGFQRWVRAMEGVNG